MCRLLPHPPIPDKHLPNPLATEHLVVQSQGMRRHIHQFWARHLGID